MGLIINIYRADYRSERCVFNNVDELTLVNVDGPFNPMAHRPAAMLDKNAYGEAVIKPVVWDHGATPMDGVAFGGSYGATSDSRFSAAVPFYGAVPIHDYAMALETNHAQD